VQILMWIGIGIGGILIWVLAMAAIIGSEMMGEKRLKMAKYEAEAEKPTPECPHCEKRMKFICPTCDGSWV
jgi:hypothetical protein